MSLCLCLTLNVSVSDSLRMSLSLSLSHSECLCPCLSFCVCSLCTFFLFFGFVFLLSLLSNLVLCRDLLLFSFLSSWSLSPSSSPSMVFVSRYAFLSFPIGSVLLVCFPFFFVIFYRYNARYSPFPPGSHCFSFFSLFF